MIEVRAEHIERAEKLLKHIPRAAPKALSRAINRAADSARTAAARKVRETYYSSYNSVISTIKINKASESNLTARVVSRGHATPLTRFQVTPKQPQPRRKAPIVVRVKQGQGGPMKSAFVARMKSGHIGVYERAGKQRAPIRQLFGPPIPEMLGNPSVSAWVERQATATLDQRLEHEIDRMLEE